ncbi:MAG TPA: diguanylate cyclase [Mycobacterium sp.]|uniref:GGDEF domain-containing protein n=1 Tax=Mycobacterium sp. TaxID=1785 RepID=UPI002C60101B|nr:diguanylate cyclase [Mycobacterium sp.]HXO82816.1 diguanylate cyclase [Mycobacterium sp.]
MGWLRLWWRQSDHYDRLSSHLQARGMDTLTRATISAVASGLAVVALATIWSPTGSRSVVSLGCTLTAAIGAVGGALLWATRWPSRTAAIRFVAAATASIALIALAQHHTVVGVLTCTAFAATASYIALFHTAPMLAAHFAVASTVGGFEASRMASRYNIVAGVSAYLLLLLLTLVVPFGVQVVVHVLGADAVRAENDQLTDLLTRRAFRRRAKARLEQGRDQLAHFVVTMIDLDQFKQLNDNHGHRTGDDALVSVARALRDTTDDTAVIGRSGGEEFVIADIWDPAEVSHRAQQLCDVIAALPFGITASIGTAGIDPAYREDSDEDLLFELISAADDAMYIAKRRGGNQAGHYEWPLPPPLSSFTEDEPDYRDGVSA